MGIKKNSFSATQHCLLLAASLVGLSEPASAHPGDFASYFGTGGTVQWPLSIGSIDNQPVAIDQSNRVIYGTSTPGGNIIGALNADGTIDGAFGASGTVALDEFLADLVIDSHNRIIVAERDGSFTATTSAVSRFLPDGSLDTSFGTGGTITLSSSHYAYVAEALTVDKDGNVFLAGNALPEPVTGESHIFAAKITSHGDLDTTFGTSGFVTVDSGGGGLTTSTATSIKLDAAGNVFVGGYSQVGSMLGLADIVKLKPGGDIDTAFGSTGVVQIDAYPGYMGPHGTDATSLAIDKSGNIVVAGVVGDWLNFSASMLTRLLPDGKLDPTFGPGMPAMLPVDMDQQGKAETVMIDGRERIVLTGVTQNLDGVTRFFAFRFNDDGSPDTSFGTGAGYRVLTNPVWGGRSAFAHDGNIVLFGNTADFSAITASSLIGYDLPPIMPPTRF